MQKMSLSAWAASFLVFAAAHQAWAVVETIDSTVRSSLEQFLADGVVNTDQASELLDETASNYPLVAEAFLDQLDPNLAVLSAGQIATVLGDPRLSTDDNPAEFGHDLAVFSLDPVASYNGVSTAVETRQITFTAEEIGEADGTELEATSFFFVNGFMLLWGDLGSEAASARFSITVEQIRPGLDPVTVLDTKMVLTRDSNGVTLTGEGGLSTDNVVLIDSFASILPLGDASLVVIPPLSVPYNYDAVVGESFTLRATVVAQVTNSPYTGAGLTLGRDLAEFLATVGELINDQVAGSDIPGVTSGKILAPAKELPVRTGTEVQVVTSRSIFGGLPCGMMGAETLFLTAVLPVAVIAGARRRRV